MEVPNSSVVGEFILNAGECMDVPSGLVHQTEALEDAELYEFSTQHFDSDSYRLVRGQVTTPRWRSTEMRRRLVEEDEPAGALSGETRSSLIAALSRFPRPSRLLKDSD